MASEFLAREDLENLMALVFQDTEFILHLAHHFASFRRSLRKSFAANCTFLLAAHRAVSPSTEQCHQQTEILSFVFGKVLISH